MNTLFHQLEDGLTILASRGVFRQAKLFRRALVIPSKNLIEDRVYAQWGNGFIRLYANSGTSIPHVTWLTMELPFHSTAVGYLGALSVTLNTKA